MNTSTRACANLGSTAAAGSDGMSEQLDHPALANQFAADRRLRIPDFLPSRRAVELRNALSASLRWRHLISGGSKPYEIDSGEFDELPSDVRDRLAAALHAEAATGFRYQYDVIRLPDAPATAAEAPRELVEFAAFMNSADMLSSMRRITGMDAIELADVQATRYRPGDFLTRHDDEAPGRNRLCAYVLSLSDVWRAEWGGLLMFNATDGQVAQTIVPQFNSLSLFAVPQPHSVSCVAPYAGTSRISVTGWLRGS